MRHKIDSSFFGGERQWMRALGCYRKPRISRRPIGERWPTSGYLSLSRKRTYVVRDPPLYPCEFMRICKGSSGYISCPFLVFRNGVSRCLLATARLIISRTIHPLFVNASPIRDRWQRHGTASAHIMAVSLALATSMSVSNPSENSGVAM